MYAFIVNLFICGFYLVKNLLLKVYFWFKSGSFKTEKWWGNTM